MWAAPLWPEQPRASGILSMGLRGSTPGEILGESLKVREDLLELGTLSVPQVMLTFEGKDLGSVRGGMEETEVNCQYSSVHEAERNVARPPALSTGQDTSHDSMQE